MVRYYLYILLSSLLTNIYADCAFNVVNNSSFPIQVEAGFYNSVKTKAIFTISPAASVESLVKSDYKCNEVSQSGLGLTYINLIGGNSLGGWIFDPKLNQIRAVGDSNTQVGAFGKSSNGSKIYLSNTVRTSPDSFTVIIKSVQSIARQNASMD